MKKVFILFFAVSFSMAAVAQKADSTMWKKGGTASLNFSQVSLSQGWAAGGQSAVSANGLLALFANWARDKATWDNNLDLAYGVLSNANSPFFKNDDRIELNSKYGRHAFKHWYYSGLLNFRSQFVEGYSDPLTNTGKLSNWMAPGYLTIALGMDFKPHDNFSLFISPLTSKNTWVMDPDLDGKFGVESGETYRGEFGGFLKMMYKRGLMENIGFTTNLDLFSNYANNPGNIDVNWTTLIDMKVNDWFAASLGTQLIYDHDIDIAYDATDATRVGPRVQFKEVLQVGLKYQLHRN